MLESTWHDDVLCLRMARTLAGRGRYFTAAYYIDSLLFDTGCVHARPETLAALSGLSVNTIVNSHSHEDHVGNNRVLQQHHGCTVYAHALTVPVLHDPRLRGPLHPYRHIMLGEPEICQATVVPAQVETKDHRFQVHHLPGHSPDHIILFEPDRGWAFTADLFVGGKDRAARPDAHGAQLIASLEKLAALEPTVIFPGSGNPRRNPQAELREKIDSVKELRHRILSLHRQGLGPRAIRARLFPRPMLMEALTLGDFSGTNLVRAHLKNS
jgi:glyoxylase-like metal-dependent hydrolase (beta-lactamase superfamily II)